MLRGRLSKTSSVTAVVSAAMADTSAAPLPSAGAAVASGDLAAATVSVLVLQGANEVQQYRVALSGESRASACSCRWCHELPPYSAEVTLMNAVGRHSNMLATDSSVNMSFLPGPPVSSASSSSSLNGLAISSSGLSAALLSVASESSISSKDEESEASVTFVAQPGNLAVSAPMALAASPRRRSPRVPPLLSTMSVPVEIEEPKKKKKKSVTKAVEEPVLKLKPSASSLSVTERRSRRLSMRMEPSAAPLSAGSKLSLGAESSASGSQSSRGGRKEDTLELPNPLPDDEKVAVGERRRRSPQSASSLVTASSVSSRDVRSRKLKDNKDDLKSRRPVEDGGGEADKDRKGKKGKEQDKDCDKEKTRSSGKAGKVSKSAVRSPRSDEDVEGGSPETSSRGGGEDIGVTKPRHLKSADPTAAAVS